jgi:hypothetical protein
MVGPISTRFAIVRSGEASRDQRRFPFMEVFE